MLYIIVENVLTGSLARVEWELGQDGPYVEIDYNKAALVVADGPELEYIRNNFENIPIKKDGKHARWLGDFAKFIALNIGE